MYTSKFSRIFFICICAFSNLLCADTIKIGIVGPFSGTYVAAGDQQWQGAIQAVEDINAQGGIHGNKLELVSADDACNPQKAIAIAKKFVAAKDIKAVIGHNCSAATLAAAKIYADANMLMITPASTTPEITEHNYQTIFRTCGKDNDQGEIAAYFIDKKLKAKRIAIFFQDSVYGKGVAESIKRALEKFGIRPIIYKAVTDDQHKDASLIRRIQTLKPDVIYFGGLHTDAGNFLKYLREYGDTTTYMGSDGIASPDFVTAAGGSNNVKNVYMTFFNDPSTIKAAKKVVKEFEEKHIIPTGYTLNSYAAVQVIAAALRNDPDKMSAWLHHHAVDSVIGQLEWDKTGDLKTNPFIVYKWNDEGEYAPYWTP